MKTENKRLYIAGEGKVFMRKSDNFIMGKGIDLGVNDSIKNYKEVNDPNPKEETDKPKKS